ncbi:chitin deacetylase [Podochytrium sp. JEL0797]|nr:chitin deacetylase [Podochytrium sp. JEL0797]
MSSFDWAPEPWQKAPAVPAWKQYFDQVNPNPAVPKWDISKCAVSGQKAWGASFDDGPSPYTSDLVNYLTKIDAKVTFYTVGSVVEENAAAMKYAFDSGNEIQLHTWSHPDLTTLSDDQIVSEFAYNAKAMYEVLGVVPKYFRPPYGASDNRVRRIAASMGLTSVAWSADTNDWQFADQGQGVMDTAVLGSFSNWIAQGRVDEISLEHDIKKEAVESGKKGMKMLKDNGYDVMTVAECLNDWSPYRNEVLRGFFESGQFDNKHAVVVGKPIASTTASTTTVKTTNAETTPSVATTTESVHTITPDAPDEPELIPSISEPFASPTTTHILVGGAMQSLGVSVLGWMALLLC